MTLTNSLFLGVVMSLLLYSKYHAVLIIFFTFLSNPALSTKYQAYLSALIGALLFLPHIYWQYTHGFPSLAYHLYERNAPAYKLSFSLEYILGQILLTGPLTGWLLLWAAFKHKTKDAFEKALKFSLVGIYIFFLISTARGRVEANWTVPAFIPLIILSHQFLSDKERWQRLLIRSVPFTLFIVLIVRVYMIMDIFPFKFLTKDEVHKNKPWADSIYKKSKGLPVAFINSYQKASKYWFYSGVPSFALNTPIYRRNNFNYWPVENWFSGKTIAAVSPKNRFYYKDSINTPLGTTGLIVIDSFFSFSTVKIVAGDKLEAVNGLIPNCELQIMSDQNHLKAFQLKRFRSASIDLIIVDKNDIVGRFSTNILLSDLTHREQSIITTFKINLPKGEYSARYSLPTSLLPDPSLNSSIIKLVVK